MSQVSLDKVVELHSPEGIFSIRDIITLENTDIVTPTKVSMASLKSLQQEEQIIQGSSKLIEIPPQDDKFSFLKKKQKPTIVTKTNSQFVSKIVANENIGKVMMKGGEIFYMFYNVGKALAWTDYLYKLQSPLSVIYFKDAYVTCHDVNQVTRDTMNAVVGFNTGDILLFWPLSGKYVRINRGGTINKNAVTCIKWVPGSENMFMASFDDGSMMLFDKDADDQNHPIPTTTEDYFFRNAPQGSKNNPRSYYKVSRKSITHITFSPDFQHVAITSMDGTLTILDYQTGKRSDVYQSFFGGMMCACWSPDGKYIIAGSQDDLLSIYAFRGKLLARCQGHYAWPSAISFDQWKCSDRHFRFASVGEDTRLCLWDFAVHSLRRKTTSMSRAKSYHDFGRSSTDGLVVHPIPNKNAVQIIEPIMCQSLGNVPLSGLCFREDALVISDRNGCVSVWARPQ